MFKQISFFLSHRKFTNTKVLHMAIIHFVIVKVMKKLHLKCIISTIDFQSTVYSLSVVDQQTYFVLNTYLLIIMALIEKKVQNIEKPP